METMLAPINGLVQTVVSRVDILAGRFTAMGVAVTDEDKRTTAIGIAHPRDRDMDAFSTEHTVLHEVAHAVDGEELYYSTELFTDVAVIDELNAFLITNEAQPVSQWGAHTGIA
jgi:hypothetical protein